MFQQGHVLTMSGAWTIELADDFQFGLQELKSHLPRNREQKHVTIHLLNYALNMDSVTQYLSLLRRVFSELEIHVNIVGEGKLSGASLLLLTGSNVGIPGRDSRKLFANSKLSLSLAEANALPEKKMGFSETEKPLPIPKCEEIRLLPQEWIARFEAGKTLRPTPEQCLQEKLIDKILTSGFTRK